MNQSFADGNFSKKPASAAGEGMQTERAVPLGDKPPGNTEASGGISPEAGNRGSSPSREALEALAQEVVGAGTAPSELGDADPILAAGQTGQPQAAGETLPSEPAQASWWGENLEAAPLLTTAASPWAHLIVWIFTLLLLGISAFSLVLAWEWFLRQELGEVGLIGSSSRVEESQKVAADSGMSSAEDAQVKDAPSGSLQGDPRQAGGGPLKPAKTWEERLREAAEILGLPAELPATAEACNREALLVVERLVADLPQRPEALALAAFFHNRQSRFQEAEAYWHKALELNVNFAPAYSGLGWLAARRGDLDQAVEYLRKATALDPYAGHAHSLLVDVLLRQGKPEQAAVAARRYVAVFPQAGDSNYWLGQALLELGQIEEAKKAYLAAIRHDPEYTAAYHSLSIVCVRLGEREDARKWREKFQVLKEKDMEEDRRRTREFHDLSVQQRFAAQYHLAAGNVHSNFGDPQKAEAHWIRGAAVHPESIDCRLALAEYYEKTQRLPEAQEQWAAIAANPKAIALHWFRKAEVEKRLGMFAEAEQSYRKAAELAPEASEPLSALVDLALSYGHRVEDLLTLAERAVALAPSAHNYFALSAVRESQGNLPGALEALEAALRQEPSHPLLRVAYERLKTQKIPRESPTRP
jgi:tetratricopeptide (TPR) repeat protein